MVVVTVLVILLYTLMDTDADLILDYSLVQVTETGSSVAMETEDLQCCLTKVLSSGLQIDSIATDRHICGCPN